MNNEGYSVISVIKTKNETAQRPKFSQNPCGTSYTDLRIIFVYGNNEIIFFESVLGPPSRGYKIFFVRLGVRALCCAVVRLFNTEKSEKNRREYDTILSTKMLLTNLLNCILKPTGNN